MFDLKIVGGTIVDGTGAPAFQGDVALDGDRIVQVGGKAGPGKRVVKAEGRLVTPGWVDVHTHYDGQATWDSEMAPSSWHGVTTVLMGNCGVTFAPVRPDDRVFLAEMMESVEDIPRDAILGGLPWDWVTYGEYLASIGRMPKGVNVGGMVGHCALRQYAMGERSMGKEVPTAAVPKAEGVAEDAWPTT